MGYLQYSAAYSYSYTPLFATFEGGHNATAFFHSPRFAEWAFSASARSGRLGNGALFAGIMA